MKFIYILPVFLTTCIVWFMVLKVLHNAKVRLLREMIPDIVGHQWVQGRDLRNALAENGIYLSYGKFYLIMAELTEEKFVDVYDTMERIDGIPVKVRSFRIKD